MHRTVHARTTEPYFPAHRSERISSVPRFSNRHCSRSMSESLSSSCCCFSSLSFFACFLLTFSACLSAYSDSMKHDCILTSHVCQNAAEIKQTISVCNQPPKSTQPGHPSIWVCLWPMITINSWDGNRHIV